MNRTERTALDAALTKLALTALDDTLQATGIGSDERTRTETIELHVRVVVDRTRARSVMEDFPETRNIAELVRGELVGTLQSLKYVVLGEVVSVTTAP